MQIVFVLELFLYPVIAQFLTYWFILNYDAQMKESFIVLQTETPF